MYGSLQRGYVEMMDIRAFFRMDIGFHLRCELYCGPTREPICRRIHVLLIESSSAPVKRYAKEEEEEEIEEAAAAAATAAPAVEYGAGRAIH